MLKSHFDAVENYLLALVKIGDNTGHSLHKGTPREAFIREFLKNHLSENVSIGTGEIINMNSKAGEKRNQHDIVLFRSEYPRIDFGGGINGFLLESVIATIEVKSKLTKAGLRKAIVAANRMKTMENLRFKGPMMSMSWVPPAPLNIVVAYKGPSKMETVYQWIQQIYSEENIDYPLMPTTGEERQKVASPAIDGIFVLGKGVLHFDNLPVSFIQEPMRISEPTGKWGIVDMKNGALLMLFLILTQAATGFTFTVPKLSQYVSRIEVPNENVHFK